MVRLIEIAQFVMLSGLGVAGAAAVWGWMFSIKARRCTDPQDVYARFSSQLLPAALIGTAVLLAGWVWFSFAHADISLAYEGIDLLLLDMDIVQIHEFRMIPVLLLILAGIFGIVLMSKKIVRPEVNEWFYFSLFFILLVFISVPLIVLTPIEGLSAMLDGLALIFGPGAAVVGVWLFAASRESASARQAFADAVTNLVTSGWFAIGLIFLSSLLILNQELLVNKLFYFGQTVVGVMIVSRIVLLTQVEKKLTAGGDITSDSWPWAARAAIAVELSGWASLLFLHAIDVTTLGYPVLTVVFAALALLIFLSIFMIERLGYAS